MIYKSPIQGWRQYQARYQLQGVACKECKKSFYPQKYLCTCGSIDFEECKFKGTGKLYSFTNVTNPAAEFKDFVPYCIGLIQLDDGPIIIAQLADVKVENLKIGMHLKAVFRKFYSNNDDGIIEYGLKFVPKDF